MYAVGQIVIQFFDLLAVSRRRATVGRRLSGIPAKALYTPEGEKRNKGLTYTRDALRFRSAWHMDTKQHLAMIHMCATLTTRDRIRITAEHKLTKDGGRDSKRANKGSKPIGCSTYEGGAQ